MDGTYVIRVAGEIAGLAAYIDGGLRFFASSRRLGYLERQYYRNTGQIIAAVRIRADTLDRKKRSQACGASSVRLPVRGVQLSFDEAHLPPGSG